MNIFSNANPNNINGLNIPNTIPPNIFNASISTNTININVEINVTTEIIVLLDEICFLKNIKYKFRVSNM